jgi:hypothetical protein
VSTKELLRVMGFGLILLAIAILTVKVAIMLDPTAAPACPHCNQPPP